MKTLCRHCKVVKVSRPRGLCWCCFYNTKIRAKYPINQRTAGRGHGKLLGARPVPPTSTSAYPGTPEKIVVMERRARYRFQIFHPLDRTLGS